MIYIPETAIIIGLSGVVCPLIYKIGWHLRIKHSRWWSDTAVSEFLFGAWLVYVLVIALD